MSESTCIEHEKRNCRKCAAAERKRQESFKLEKISRKTADRIQAARVKFGIPAAAPELPADWTKDDHLRDCILDGIARGVEKLDRQDDPIEADQRPLGLWMVYVALLDAKGETVRVACLSQALTYVSARLHSDEAGRSLEGIVDAHVFRFEDRCPCGKHHAEETDGS